MPVDHDGVGRGVGVQMLEPFARERTEEVHRLRIEREDVVEVRGGGGQQGHGAMGAAGRGMCRVDTGMRRPAVIDAG